MDQPRRQASSDFLLAGRFLVKEDLLKGGSLYRADGTLIGHFGEPPDLSRIYGADGYRYDPWGQGRVHEVDYDGDGRGDLVFWSGWAIPPRGCVW